MNGIREYEQVDGCILKLKEKEDQLKIDTQQVVLNLDPQLLNNLMVLIKAITEEVEYKHQVYMKH